MSRGLTMSREGVRGSLVQKSKVDCCHSFTLLRSPQSASSGIVIDIPACERVLCTFTFMGSGRDPAGRDKYAIMLNCSHVLSIRMWGEAPYRCEKAKWPFAKVSQITVNSVFQISLFSFRGPIVLSSAVACAARTLRARRPLHVSRLATRRDARRQMRPACSCDPRRPRRRAALAHH